jgi:hypothetical protein
MMRNPAAFALLATALLLAIAPGSGEAQQYPRGYIGQGRPVPPQQQPRGFFDLLFGPRQFGPPPPQSGSPPVSRRPARPAEPPLNIVEVAPKDENARKILVIGDFIASGLAWGLDQTFAEEPKISVVDKSNDTSGLVRDDYYDWNKSLPGILNEVKPDIVVLVTGANDRQQMRIAKDRLAPHSEGWEKAYTARVQGIVDTLRVFGRPFFWVSAPPLRSSAASRDMVYLNGFYKTPVTAAGGDFVDIWNGFADENGRYISSGPDVDGQLRALRTSDGINFTRAGRLKLAFYVEREIRKQTGIGTGAVDLLASTSQGNQIEIGPDGVKRLVGPVISLGNPLPGASRELVGAPDKPEAAASTDTPQYLFIVKGTSLPAVAGRADDFSWPPRQHAASAAPEEPAKVTDATVPPSPTARPASAAN